MCFRNSKYVIIHLRRSPLSLRDGRRGQIRQHEAEGSYDCRLESSCGTSQVQDANPGVHTIAPALQAGSLEDGA